MTDWIEIFSLHQKPTIVYHENALAPIDYAISEFIEAIQKTVGISMARQNYRPNIPPPLIAIGTSNDLDLFISLQILSNFPSDETIGNDGMFVKWVSEEDRNILLMYSPSATGILFGVYTFLHEFAGVRWFTSEAALFPKQEKILIPKNLEKIYRPGFPFRLITYIDCQDPEWAVRNRLNINFFAEEQHGGRLIDQGKMPHTFYQLVPPQIYFKDHPEYFALLPDQSNPKGPMCRQASGGGAWGTIGQLCLTNPEV